MQGVVVDEEGNYVKAAIVKLIKEQNSSDNEEEVVTYTLTEEDGEFLIQDLNPDEEYIIEVHVKEKTFEETPVEEASVEEKDVEEPSAKEESVDEIHAEVKAGESEIKISKPVKENVQYETMANEIYCENIIVSKPIETRPGGLDSKNKLYLSKNKTWW